jgi:hypothetical protein
MQPVRLKLGDDILPDKEITIISQYYDDFTKFDEYMENHPSSQVVAAAVLGYPCRQETVVQKSLPKIAGFWSKLAYVLDSDATILVDKDFVCYTSFLADVGLTPQEDSIPKGYHFLASSDLLKSLWLVKMGNTIPKSKRVLISPKRPFSYNYLLYLSCRYNERLNPIEDVTLDIASYDNNEPYIASVSLIHHLSKNKPPSDLKREYVSTTPTVTKVAEHLECCRGRHGKRLTLLSVNLVNAPPSDHDYIILLDWETKLAQLMTFHKNITLEPPFSTFLDDLMSQLKFNITRVKYCPSTQSWQTYDDVLFRFIEKIPQIAPTIDTYVKNFVPVMNQKKESILDYQKAIQFIQENLFNDQYQDEKTFQERTVLGNNLVNWFKTLNSTYPDQIDLQVSQYIVQFIGERCERMAYVHREEYSETFCAAWITWFINERIIHPDLTADAILGNYLQGSITKNNFKILLEFCRGLYLLATKVHPPSTCLTYLGDQYANMFLD